MFYHVILNLVNTNYSTHVYVLVDYLDDVYIGSFTMHSSYSTRSNEFD